MNMHPFHKSDECPTPTFRSEAHIKASSGGRVVVGNDRFGYSQIIFRPNDLLRDTTITFEWTPQPTPDGMVNLLRFGPDGAVFRTSVRVEVCCKDVAPENMRENKLRLFWFNEEKGSWELIPAVVMNQQKKIITFVSHFSRYALGLE